MRSQRATGLSLVIAVALLFDARAVQAAAPEARCQEGRYKAAAQYTACHQKLFAKSFDGMTRFQEKLSKCRDKYQATWAKLQAKASATGASCDAVRFLDNGDGTVTDKLSGLQWEKKTDDASIHDKDNVYTWTAATFGAAADGTAFTSFLSTLNGGGCFAGQCDWRLPTVVELQTILLLDPFPCGMSPCIDAVFGPTANLYWSSTTLATGPIYAWSVAFDTGFVDLFDKGGAMHVRAVRGGL